MVAGETGRVQVAQQLDAFGAERIGHLGNQVASSCLAGVVFLPGFDRSRTIGLGVANRENDIARSRRFYHFRKTVHVKFVNGPRIGLVCSVLADALRGPMEHQPVASFGHPLRAGPRP